MKCVVISMSVNGIDVLAGFDNLQTANEYREALVKRRKRREEEPAVGQPIEGSTSYMTLWVGDVDETLLAHECAVCNHGK